MLHPVYYKVHIKLITREDHKKRKSEIITVRNSCLSVHGGVHTPPQVNNPSRQTPPGRHPLSADTPLGRHPLDRYPPWADIHPTCPRQTPHG